MPSRRIQFVALGSALGVGCGLVYFWLSSVGRAVPPRPAATVAATAVEPVHSGRDLRAYVAELRRQGIAETLIAEWATRELQRHFRREQHKMELWLEQGRYPQHYWESPASIETLYELERTRQSELARLDRELGAALRDLLGDAAVPPAVRSPLFSRENPAPKFDFLSEPSRQKFVAALLDEDADGTLSSVERLDLAERLLPPDEFALYAKWNSPAATALGPQLAGFQPTQAEYDAIFRWQTVAGSEEGFPSEAAKTAAADQLKATLGAERYAAFERRQEPAYQTVIQMLDRWGLPLTAAEAVLSLRQSAVAVMDSIRQAADISDEEKGALVEETQKYFREQITAKLGVPAGLVPDDDLL